MPRLNMSLPAGQAVLTARNTRVMPPRLGRRRTTPLLAPQHFPISILPPPFKFVNRTLDSALLVRNPSPLTGSVFCHPCPALRVIESSGCPYAYSPSVMGSMIRVVRVAFAKVMEKLAGLIWPVRSVIAPADLFGSGRWLARAWSHPCRPSESFALHRPSRSSQ